MSKIIVLIGFVSLSTALSAFAADSGVVVNLFEWTWNDVGMECEKVLRPNGIEMVQVAPPQEHVMIASNPWYDRYQPVSYNLNSRGGTEQEFAQMIAKCNASGVKVIVDAIINHMASSPPEKVVRMGSSGSKYTYYHFPDYLPEHFHRFKHEITHWENREEIQFGNLAGCADLDTANPYVQDKLGAYLQKLLDLGVAGFRIDAAKHIPIQDLVQIYTHLKKRAFIYHEIADFKDGPIPQEEYYFLGYVTEFKYTKVLAQNFLNGKISNLSNYLGANLGADWGFAPNARAMVFIDNHDTQRGSFPGLPVLSYKNGNAYLLANVFMLAWPYGTPIIMSGFRFDHKDEGSPKLGPYAQPELWALEHRHPMILSMIQFRKKVENADVNNWWSNGNNQIAFGRGENGFVVINNENNILETSFQTHLPAGNYKNFLLGNGKNQYNDKHQYTVDGNHRLHAKVPQYSALVLVKQ